MACSSMIACHFCGPVLWTDSPLLSTATMLWPWLRPKNCSGAPKVAVSHPDAYATSLERASVLVDTDASNALGSRRLV